jgi:hypothetical protein
MRDGLALYAGKHVIDAAGYGLVTSQGVRISVQPRDSRGGRGVRVAGRPPFGLGPIARVSTIARADEDYAAPAIPEDRRDVRAGGRADPPMSRSAIGGDVRRVPITIGMPSGRAMDPARTRAFGLPNLRRNVCPHFYVTGARGALAIQAPHLLKALVRQEAAVSRCQLRGGVHLEQSYVNDVCLSPRFNQCVFYEEDLTRA